MRSLVHCLYHHRYRNRQCLHSAPAYQQQPFQCRQQSTPQLMVQPEALCRQPQKLPRLLVHRRPPKVWHQVLVSVLNLYSGISYSQCVHAAWTTCGYVQKDGQVNPDVRALNGPDAINDLAQAVIYNAVAYGIKRTSTYAKANVNMVLSLLPPE